jgi:hypothetical protein
VFTSNCPLFSMPIWATSCAHTHFFTTHIHTQLPMCTQAQAGAAMDVGRFQHPSIQLGGNEREPLTGLSQSWPASSGVLPKPPTPTPTKAYCQSAIPHLSCSGVTPGIPPQSTSSSTCTHGDQQQKPDLLHTRTVGFGSGQSYCRTSSPARHAGQTGTLRVVMPSGRVSSDDPAW